MYPPLLIFLRRAAIVLRVYCVDIRDEWQNIAKLSIRVYLDNSRQEPQMFSGADPEILKGGVHQ